MFSFSFASLFNAVLHTMALSLPAGLHSPRFAKPLAPPPLQAGGWGEGTREGSAVPQHYFHPLWRPLGLMLAKTALNHESKEEKSAARGNLSLLTFYPSTLWWSTWDTCAHRETH